MIQVLTPLAAAILTLLASLALFLSLKRELAHSVRRQQKRVEEIMERIQSFPPAPADTGVGDVQAHIPVSGLNVHKRVSALRMLRQGENAAHIAAALNVARAEIDLLIRVHELTLRPLLSTRASAGGVPQAGGVRQAGDVRQAGVVHQESVAAG